MKPLPLAGIFALTITASFADTIDATTPCSVAIQVFDSDKRAGQVLAGASSPHVEEVGNYVMGVMEQLDKKFMQDGSLASGRTSPTKGSTRSRRAQWPTAGSIQSGQSTVLPRRCIAVSATSTFS
jgi:hypothetical protein